MTSLVSITYSRIYESPFPDFCTTLITSSLFSVNSFPSLKIRNSIISTRKNMKLPLMCVMQDPKSFPTTEFHAGPYVSSSFCPKR
ncbi:dynein light chain LC6, flagellar outer arm [Trifolium repens]|nr:dynein light chain LC6, flagellar outer arm [Trifolium repens]